MAMPHVSAEERSRLAALTALKILRRKDEGVASILCTASHVIVYELERDAGESGMKWKHTDIQGVLHIIERSSEPWFKLIVLNRKGVDNLVEDLLPEKLEVEYSDELMMYKNVDGTVRGIWFYDSSEYDQCKAAVESIMSGESQHPPAPQQAPNFSQINHETGHQGPDQLLYAEVEKGSQGDHQTGNGIERFFPDLQFHAPQDASDGQPPPDTRPSVAAVPEHAQVSVEPSYESHEHHYVKHAQEPSGPQIGGSAILDLLQGADNEAQQHSQADPAFGAFHDTAIVSQSIPHAELHPPQEPSSESELLALLEQASLEPNRKLGKEEFRATIIRLLQDPDYFDQVYARYASN